MTFAFTETEKDLILLGVSQIIRVENGVTTTYTINTFGDNSYKFVIIKERIANDGNLDIHSLFATHHQLLESTYPQVYNSYTNPNNMPQTITATTHYAL